MRGLSSMADCARILNQIVRMSSSPQCPDDFLPLYILAAKSCLTSAHSLEHRVGRVLCFFSSRRYWDSPTPYPLSRRRLWSPPSLVRGGGEPSATALLWVCGNLEGRENENGQWTRPHTLQSPETESLHSRSWIVKTSFNHIQSFEQNITVI